MLEVENRGCRRVMIDHMSFLLRSCHENILQIVGYSVNGPALCVVYEYMPRGSLFQLLNHQVCSIATTTFHCREWSCHVAVCSSAYLPVTQLDGSLDDCRGNFSWCRLPSPTACDSSCCDVVKCAGCRKLHC